MFGFAVVLGSVVRLVRTGLEHVQHLSTAELHLGSALKMAHSLR